MYTRRQQTCAYMPCMYVPHAGNQGTAGPSATDGLHGAAGSPGAWGLNGKFGSCLRTVACTCARSRYTASREWPVNAIITPSIDICICIYVYMHVYMCNIENIFYIENSLSMENTLYWIE